LANVGNKEFLYALIAQAFAYVFVHDYGYRPEAGRKYHRRGAGDSWWL